MRNKLDEKLRDKEPTEIKKEPILVVDGEGNVTEYADLDELKSEMEIKEMANKVRFSKGILERIKNNGKLQEKFLKTIAEKLGLKGESVKIESISENRILKKKNFLND